MSVEPILRQPQQERSRRSLERILTAGTELLVERGYDGFGIAELCARAGVSAGALYGRFAGKDAVILAIHGHAVDAMSREGALAYSDDTGWEGLDVAATIERAVTVLLQHYEAHAPLLKVFILRSAIDEAMQRQGAGGMTRLADAFTARLLTRAADIPRSDAEAAIRACFAIAFESASWHVAFGAQFDVVLATDTGIRTRLPAICRLYLLDSGRQ